jgi:hypothetical protein
MNAHPASSKTHRRAKREGTNRRPGTAFGTTGKETSKIDGGAQIAGAHDPSKSDDFLCLKVIPLLSSDRI